MTGKYEVHSVENAQSSKRSDRPFCSIGDVEFGRINGIFNVSPVNIINHIFSQEEALVLIFHPFYTLFVV